MVVDTIKRDSVKNKGITGWQECNNCTTEVLIAIWDDEASIRTTSSRMW